MGDKKDRQYIIVTPSGTEHRVFGKGLTTSEGLAFVHNGKGLAAVVPFVSGCIVYEVQEQGGETNNTQCSDSAAHLEYDVFRAVSRVSATPETPGWVDQFGYVRRDKKPDEGCTQGESIFGVAP